MSNIQAGLQQTLQSVIHYDHCPLCASPRINEVLTATDHTVSRLPFSIWECADCTGRFTQDIPTQNEIGSFYKSEAYISHTDSSQGFINRLYHRVRSITLGNKKNIVARKTGLKKGKLLDVGAGTGAFASFMQKAGWSVSGLEPDLDTIERAKQINQIDLQPVDKLFQLEGGSFDAITLWHVLEHVHGLHEYLEQFKKLLRPGGKLFIAVPNYTSYDAAVYGEFWAAYDVPRHLYHFSPFAMKQLVTKHGFAIEGLLPMWFDSFYVSMLSEQYKTGRQRLFRACFNGLVSNSKAVFIPGRASSVIYVLKHS
jgi:2-polyprenyl-3-methyl-5-hydroxy-6-metoxy-1,4-benzoquinol methylase